MLPLLMLEFASVHLSIHIIRTKTTLEYISPSAHANATLPHLAAHPHTNTHTHAHTRIHTRDLKRVRWDGVVEAGRVGVAILNHGL